MWNDIAYLGCVVDADRIKAHDSPFLLSRDCGEVDNFWILLVKRVEHYAVEFTHSAEKRALEVCLFDCSLCLFVKEDSLCGDVHPHCVSRESSFQVCVSLYLHWRLGTVPGSCYCLVEVRVLYLTKNNSICVCFIFHHPVNLPFWFLHQFASNFVFFPAIQFMHVLFYDLVCFICYFNLGDLINDPVGKHHAFHFLGCSLNF